jgi:hypothetical protein
MIVALRFACSSNASASAAEKLVLAEFRYERRDTLKVPTFRYVSGGGFRFD